MNAWRNRHRKGSSSFKKCAMYLKNGAMHYHKHLNFKHKNMFVRLRTKLLFKRKATHWGKLYCRHCNKQRTKLFKFFTLTKNKGMLKAWHFLSKGKCRVIKGLKGLRHY